MTRWFTVSIAANLVLGGILLGLLMSDGILHYRAPPPPPLGRADMISALMRKVIVDEFDEPTRRDALEVIDQRALDMKDAVAEIGEDDLMATPGRDKVSRQFIEGTLDQRAVEDWIATRQTIGGAQLRFISGVFLDLTSTLDQPARRRLIDALRREIDHGPPSPPPHSGS
ncbi:hypothetical protein [Rhodospirillum rubrum]|uniref:Uncharacterized protein n=1 Tax=Rhodospirillum rubrum (strain ATCC 11170 / ATH 1.1.1 / DSM 467 / LMG 4362 / NCIMB 8255 / S1) TaxID=269796 RepID=Q2RRA6_RHORT|nr:hypothetical protein [Rhodospirillum rubrum]ABC23339.1 hypothetical protein Rru_A2539 [Rhodospirillum rubrum ATCC 11170]AEO49072.1 hypothetical protein F11_13040 [Rhodospirillum rubrum F11]MBK5954982.1 hypothetical protein [Rhodospirillum rubrum]QXG79312.1 hypothetical protein KUL73_13105 [Rhodospirillum rubrum]